MEFRAIVGSCSNTTVTIFKSLQKLYRHLTKEEDQVQYEEVSEPQATEEPNEPVESDETIIEDESVKIECESIHHAREWAMRKIDLLHEADRHRNARALEAEFNEWIHIPDGVDEFEYISIENPEWTEEQEIDTK
jgi:hypothetical protein